MNKENAKAGRQRLGAVIGAILAGTVVANAAHAQTESAAGNAAQPSPQIEEVTVTGSRIVRRDFQANSPITTVDAARFEDSSTVAMESVINQLPQFVPAINQFDSGGYAQGSIATPGAATVSLRGLGSNRNLVLLDGHRAMPVNATMAVSINTIPSAAIARVETITGGASSVYGADAVAGVVNFITKKNFQGVDFDYQRSETEQGDGTESRFSILLGADFDRGNVMLGLERSSRDEVYKRDRSFYTDGWADPSTTGTQTFWSDPGMSVQPLNPPSQAAIDQIFSDAPAGSVHPNDTFYLNPDGTVYKQSADGAYRYNGPTLTPQGDVWRFIQQSKDGTASSDGNLGQNRSYELAQIPLERYSAYGHGHLDVAENLTAFVDVLFSESSTRAVGEDSPLLGGWRSSAPHGNGVYAPSVDANGNTLADYTAGGRFGLNCPPVGGCTKSQAFPTPPEVTALLDSRPDPEADWEFRTLSSWAGPRRSYVDTTTYQFTAGLDGSLKGGDWTWELYGSHGRTSTAGTYGGMVSLARWRFVTGQPNYGTGMFYTGNVLGAGFSSGTATCTSGFPIVENFTPSQDCQNSVSATSKTAGGMEQNIAEFDLQGGLADLPAGNLRFAVGAAYRENTYSYLADTLNSQDSILDLPAGIFPSANTEGSTNSKEVYGELSVPLLAQKPGAQDMSLELGYRYAKNDPSNDVDSWKALLDWRIVDRVRFRGGRQIANRSPNVAELFQSAEQQVVYSPYGDWCSDLNPNNPESPNPALNPNAAQVRAICEARMGPVGALTYYDPNSTGRSSSAYQWRFSNLTGNPDLHSEQAETWTAGIVADVTDNVTITVDYWSIAISDMITAQSADVLYSKCFSPITNPTFDPNYATCQQIQRDPATGQQANAAITYTNQGAIDTRGYDLEFDWNGDLGPGSMSVNFKATILDKIATRVDPGAQWNDWKGTSGPGDLQGVNPYAFDYKTFTTAEYRFGNWSTTLRWRHLPSIESLAVLTNPNSTFEKTGAYDEFDFAGRYVIGDKWQLRYGVDNLFDAQPERTFPDSQTSASGNTYPSYYDILGRRFYVGFNVTI